MSLTEQYINTLSGGTTLSANVTSSGSTTIQVTSASVFPTSPQFRIRILSEIMLVTGISGTTFTVVRGYEGTTATTYSSGEIVSHDITAGSIIQANIARSKYPVSPGFIAPVFSDFTWQNQGTAGASQTGNVITLTESTNATVDARLLWQAVPSTPYKITAFFHIQPTLPSTEFDLGLAWWQSTGSPSVVLSATLYRYSTTQQLVYQQNFSSFTTLSSSAASVNPQDANNWLQIGDDGTNQTWSVSRDGLNFIQLHSAARNSGFNRVGIMFYNKSSTTTMTCSVLSYAIS